jgi:tRNA pseudouridine65 synthase
VHRLDHRTSGASLLTFDSGTAGLLHDAAIRKGQKKYIALVRGEWGHPNEIIVDRPLKVQDEIKEAKTKFTLLTTTGDEDERSSLLLCEPLTGRTHQIRRHAHFINHPIIGDTQHGDSKINRWWRENKGLNRLALHCWSIEFRLNEEQHICMAPLSEDFQEVLQKTPLWGPAIIKEPQLAMKPYDERGGSNGRNYQESLKTPEEC